MSSKIEQEIQKRRVAEAEIMDYLKEQSNPITPREIFNEIDSDDYTARRALLRLAASGRVQIDSHFNVILNKG